MALASTGGAAMRILRRPSCSPSKPVMRALGCTWTDRVKRSRPLSYLNQDTAGALMCGAGRYSMLLAARSSATIGHISKT